MKYRDPKTGEIKSISVKASDTLPIGSVVEFEGETIPEGWEAADDNSMGNVIVDDIKCKNKFVGSLKQGVYLYSDGSYDNGTSSMKNYLCSIVPMDVTPGEQINVSLPYATPEFAFLFYKEDGSFIKVVMARSAIVPENAAKCHIDIKKTDSASSISLSDIAWIQVESGPVVTEYVEPKSYGYTSGKNENGSWIKYDDGTLICRQRIDTGSVNIGTEWGGMYVYNCDTVYNFPVPFIEEPDISITTGATKTAYGY